MAAELNREDFFSNELIEAPLKLAKNMDTLAASTDNVRKIAMEVNKSLEGATSIQKLKKDTEQLTGAEIELEKISKQLITVQNKSNDTVIEQSKVLAEANRKLKEKTTLGDRDSKSVNAQNASYKVLEAALVKNKNAYKELTTAEERNSKAGKELLHIIQSQDKEVKELGKSMGEAQKNVGNYAESFGALDSLVGGSIGKFKSLGKELLALASNPFFLAIGAAIGVFKLLQAATDIYYTTTLEGEEAAKRSQTTWESFFLVFKKRIQETGKEASEQGNAIKEFFANLLVAAAADPTSADPRGEQNRLIQERVQLQKELLEIEREAARLTREHIRDVVDDAGIELKVNQLLEDSKNKLKLTDEQRLQAVRNARALVIEQAKDDVTLAQRDLFLQEEIIRVQGGKIAQVHELNKLTGIMEIRSKSLSEYTDEEINDLKVEGDQIKLLSDLQIGLIKVQSDLSVKKKALDRVEFGIFQEIEKTRIDLIRRSQDAELKRNTQVLENDIATNQAILKNERTSADQEAALAQAIGQQQIELIRKQKEAELNVVRRAAEDRNKELAQIRAQGYLELNPELTSKELLAIQDQYLEEALRKDIAYRKEKDAVTRKYNQDEIDQNRATIEAIIRIRIKGFTETTSAERKILDERIQLIKDNAIKRGHLTEQDGKDILKAQKELSDEYIQIQIDEINKILAIKGLSAEQEKQYQEKLYQLKAALQDAFFNQLRGKYADEIEFITKLQSEFGKFTSYVGTLFHALTDRRLQEIDMEQDKVEEAHDARIQQIEDELDTFVGSEEDKKAFALGAAQEKKALNAELAKQQEQFDKQRIDAQRKAAIYDKAVSAIQAAIGVTLSVIQAGVITPLAIATAIAGGLMVAGILAKPIPQYAEGGKTKGGDIIAGELGRELMISPGGRLSLTPATATVMKGVPAGTEIVPADETMSLLAMAGLRMSELSNRGYEKQELNSLGREIKSLHHTVKNKKEVHFNVSKQGAERILKNGESRIKLLNDLFG